MRKGLFFLLIILTVFSTSVYANNARTYSKRDNLYKRIESLATATRTIVPDGISPISESALKLYFQRIDRNAIQDPILEKEYDDIRASLYEEKHLYEEEDFALDANLRVNLQASIFSQADFDWSNSTSIEPEKIRFEETLTPYRYQDPFLSGTLRMHFGPNVSLEAAIDAGNNQHHQYESSLSWLFNPYKYGWHSPFMYKEGEDLTSFSLDIPHRAGLSVSNSYFSFIMGRYDHEIGNGETGNLVVGDNFNYQEIMLLSFFSKPFSYSFSVTNFNMLEDTADKTEYFSPKVFSGLKQIRAVHHFDVVLFNRARIFLDLGTMLKSTAFFDSRLFFPFMILHNYANYDNTLEKKDFDEANNIFACGFEIALMKNWSLYFSFVLDQAQTAFEDQSSVPPSYGVQTNLKAAYPLKKGMLSSFIEFVYTNPWLYLNGKYDTATGRKDNNLDYIVGYYNSNLSSVGYSGYVYGPDTITAALGSTFSSFSSSLELSGLALFRVQGENGIRIKENGYKNTIIDSSSATIDEGWTAYESKEKEYLLELKLECNYGLNQHTTLYGGFGLFCYWNYNNTRGDNRVKPIGSVALKWSLC